MIQVSNMKNNEQKLYRGKVKIPVDQSVNNACSKGAR